MASEVRAQRLSDQLVGCDAVAERLRERARGEPLVGVLRVGLGQNVPQQVDRRQPGDRGYLQHGELSSLELGSGQSPH
jgi:hypothetical protein